MKRKICIGLVFGLLLLSGFARSVCALSIAAMEKEDLLREAPVIVHGRVEGQTAHYGAKESDPNYNCTVTEYQVRVDRVYKGSCPEVITVKLISRFAANGNRDDDFYGYSNFKLDVDQEAVLLLDEIAETDGYYDEKSGYKVCHDASGYFSPEEDGLYHSDGYYPNTVDLATFEDEARAAGGEPTDPIPSSPYAAKPESPLPTGPQQGSLLPIAGMIAGTVIVVAAVVIFAVYYVQKKEREK